MTAIDLNCDLGECAERVFGGDDIALLELITSANIACGGHAGDEATMAAMVAAARDRGVAIGAHPGYCDKANFGRLSLPMSPDQIEQTVADQVQSLARIAKTASATLIHAKPHGALYHDAMHNPAIAEAFARGVKQCSADIALVGQAGAPALEIWRRLGFRVMAEAFADRTYEADGRLRSRSLPGALIEVPTIAAAQAVSIARDACVISAAGSAIAISADTLCIHSDTPNSLAVVRAVRSALTAAGIHIQT